MKTRMTMQQMSLLNKIFKSFSGKYAVIEILFLISLWGGIQGYNYTWLLCVEIQFIPTQQAVIVSC